MDHGAGGSADDHKSLRTRRSWWCPRYPDRTVSGMSPVLTDFRSSGVGSGRSGMANVPTHRTAELRNPDIECRGNIRGRSVRLLCGTSSRRRASTGLCETSSPRHVADRNTYLETGVATLGPSNFRFCAGWRQEFYFPHRLPNSVPTAQERGKAPRIDSDECCRLLDG